MIEFTGFEYLCIDAANNYGLDKKLFEERIQWVKDNMDVLESKVQEADTPALYLKAVQAIRKAQQGIPTGHLVGMDAVCSGVQLMSVLTGCKVGAEATGLVNPSKRADAYSECTKNMQMVLGSSFHVERADAKDALMKSMYGSTAVPKRIFGEDTPELAAFYKAAEMTAPGAWTLLQELLAAWQPYALVHEWQLPDGFEVKVKVMNTKEVRVEVDELDHASFTYEFSENVGSKKGLSIPANAIHSVDSYVARTMHRRLNHDPQVLAYASDLLETEVLERAMGNPMEPYTAEGMFDYYVQLFDQSQMADCVIFPYLEPGNVRMLSDEHLRKLNHIAGLMEKHKPFELVTVHDDFKCHPNNVNHMRFMYKEILAELAESELLSWIMRSILKCEGTYKKLSNNLGDFIRASNYGLT